MEKFPKHIIEKADLSRIAGGYAPYTDDDFPGKSTDTDVPDFYGPIIKWPDYRKWY